MLRGPRYRPTGAQRFAAVDALPILVLAPGFVRRAATKPFLKVHSPCQSADHALQFRFPDGTLCVNVCLKDKTLFSLRFASDIFIVVADMSDWRTGNYEMIREYMKPIPG